MGIYDEADLYCAAFDRSLDAEVDWLLERFPEARSVLEPFCGNARYGPVFAARGLEYVGFDNSQAMLARAPSGERITVLRADAARFEIPQTPTGGFDLAWCPINSLSHLTDEPDIITHLRCAGRHLAPGGCYVVELDPVRCDGPWEDPPGTENVWTFEQADGTTVSASWKRERCDLAARIGTERSTFRRKRGEEVLAEITQTHRMRMWTCEDLRRIPAEAGFSVDERVIIHKDDPPGPETRLSPGLENSGLNYYFFLQPVAMRS